MKLICLFLSGVFLLSCQHAPYKPDITLKKSWTPDLEMTQPHSIPYALVYNVGTKKVIYVAVGSQYKNSDAFVRALINKEKPEIVLTQGKPVGEKNGASANRAQMLQHLNQRGVSERDLVIFQVLTLMNQIWQFEVKNDSELEKRAVEYLKTHPDAKKFNISYPDVQRWFKEKMGRPMTMNLVKDTLIFAPQDPKLPSTNMLQKISSYQDEIDDKIVLETLANTLNQHENILIVRAGSKYVTEREVLNKMLGTAPSEMMGPDQILTS